MRTVRELRQAGLIAYLASLAIALLISGLVHWALGGRGLLSWQGLNFFGLLEGLVFVVSFTFSLWIAKRAVRAASSALLTAGLIAPSPARKLAKPIQTLEAVESFEGRLAVLIEDGVPVGVLGLGDNIVPWEEAPVVSGEVAASELSPLFWRYPVVIVADGNTIHGAIRREAFRKYMGV
ncbi:MAG TPA: hypothetical protein VFS50_10410 [Meiothermus sp.]|nr:hypothetical protein [Meiothermus sp.]